MCSLEGAVQDFRGFKATLLININISSVVEFQEWWVLKRKIFGRNQCTQRKKLKFSGDEC